ncbi:retinoic acid receptor responder protein 1 [Rhineura floridana]|uniref:retinoic acid receptor responder protein 1 n=1 Tax=Rhineura floridana TaxID=261503 RepID=UPI002AC84060|nr:retinoic acid receptor responder protein 1 [Rhineura floridana]
MQRPKASLLLAAALLVLSPSSAWRSGGADYQEQPPPKQIWEDQLLLPSRGAVNSQVTRAAQTALDYYNYLQGSPSNLRAPRYVKKSSIKTIPGVGRKYFLQFASKDIQTGQNLGICFATVFYRRQKPKPQVDIVCSHNKDPGQRLQEDYVLYRRIKDDTESSPGTLWGLATIGSSYVAWEKSTEDLSYTLTQMKNVKQWERDDDSLEFDYTILLSSNFSEFLSCHMSVVWKPGQPVKVKYDCSTYDESAESADGSGVEMGSTNDLFIEPESNF